MNPFTPIDLNKLPLPDLVDEVGFEAELARLKARYLTLDPDAADILDLDSTPEAKNLQLVAYEIVLLKNLINQSTRANMVAYSTGQSLDNLGALIPLTREVGESDDIFRSRIQLAPEGFSVAGPIGAYKFFSEAAHEDIVEVAVFTPEPGRIDVHVLTKPAADPAEAASVLSAVTDALAGDVRPLTDAVTITSAGLLYYNIIAELSIGSGPSPAIVLSASQASAEAYAASRRKLGLAVTLTGLIAALSVPGVEDLSLISPVANVEPSEIQAAHLDVLSVTEAA